MSQSFLKLPVSIPTFNEIEMLLEQHGIKINERGTIELTRTLNLIRPNDYRLTAIRKDVLTAITQLKGQYSTTEHFIGFCQQVFDWVHTGKLVVPEEPIPLKELKPTDKPQTGGW